MEIKDIRVQRSHKRVKTVSARLIQGVMHVSAPNTMPQETLHAVIQRLKKRLEKNTLRRRLNTETDLTVAAQNLNQKYFDGKLRVVSIAYSTDQDRKYGVCKVSTGEILISHRLSAMPDWVRDYVIVHELAHLIEPNHGKRFHALVMRYPLAERAKGFLMAKGFDEATDTPAAGPAEEAPISKAPARHNLGDGRGLE